MQRSPQNQNTNGQRRNKKKLFDDSESEEEEPEIGLNTNQPAPNPNHLEDNYDSNNQQQMNNRSNLVNKIFYKENGKSH